MARIQPQAPALNQGNRIYLYGLLARELGCGKQTFLPRVEEALATDRMTAEDLGFENTRALLEAMGDCVSLTVFKGGRVYATVVAQPAWDEALANPVESKGDAAAKGGKPWKRKKADKSLKPVKPRRVKRAVAEEQAEKPSVDVEAGSNIGEKVTPTGVEPDATMTEEAPTKNDQTAKSPDREAAPSAASAAPDTEANTEPAAATDVEANRPDQTKPAEKPMTSSAPIEPKATVEDALPAEHVKETIETSTVSKPTISLTVTYDPYSGDEGETVLEASGAASSSSPTPKPQNTADKVSDRKPAVSVKPSIEQEASSPASKTAQKPKTTPQAESTPQVEPIVAKPAPASTAPASTPTAEKSLPAESKQAHVPCPEAPVPEPATAAKPMAVAEPAAAAEPTAATELNATAHASAHRQPSPEALKGYPRDFAAEVYCPLDTVAKISEMLPLGTSVTPLLASDFMRARELGLIEGTRSRATFPLRVQHADSTDPITVTIRKQTGRGLPWTVIAVL